MTVIALNYRRESEQEAIREQLARITNSSAFQRSRRRQRFLEYIVNETLAGRGERLKGYNVALAVFDRPKTFDPAIDPLVRIEAARLREKLREYYETDGRADPIRIDLPKGRYTPRIEFRQPMPTPQSATEHGSPANDAIAADASSESQPTRRRRWKIALPIFLLLLVLGAGVVWWTRDHWKPVQDVAQEELAKAAGNVPTIAVLPFTNLSGDPKQDYFSDGLTEDILTELSRARDLRVLARNTTFQYKGKAVDVMKLGRELDARYVLEGSIKRSNDRLRVNAQLIDAKTGTHIWADRYDRDMAEVFLVQDEIVNEIVGKIAGSYGAIERNEANSAARKSRDEIEAYDLVLRAREKIQWDWTKDTFGQAEALLREAIKLDPTSAQAHRELAWFGVMGWIFQLDDPPVAQDEIIAQATKAVEIDPADARARMVAASAYFFTKNLDLFAREADEALKLAPYDAEIMATLACMISSSGDHERGVALAEKANALNADAATGWYHSTVYTAAYLKGDYQRALEVAQQNQDQEMFYSYLEIIPIYGQLGMNKEALDAWRLLQKQLPGATAATFEDWWRLWNIRDEEVAKLMEGVYKSGVLQAKATLFP
ncbi:MAG: tetratricopeptide repeat protein [Actinomycetota bacterium]